ncbi:hypothetical protein BCEN4_740144 [Burkholderia cenocepacia]|uniref:hypothetical protein n=1 Tax=Burkholderia cenocepacia TaxID=95486 RepID=UPI00192C59D3|nr:hypothetical protein [Burkholderia cenocepacia]CAD9228038.1 hypothetical protein BCEN4_740144 [Burkholderia cenocepacia]
MQINHKTNLSLGSKLMLPVARLFLPDVSKLVLPKGQYVDNEEMYCLQQDRLDSNPDAFHPDRISHREQVKRNTLVSLVRRQVWAHACKMGIVLYAIGLVFSFVLNTTTDGISTGINKGISTYNTYTQSIEAEKTSKEDMKKRAIENVTKAANQLKADCQTGKFDQDYCMKQMQSLKHDYEEISKQ